MAIKVIGLAGKKQCGKSTMAKAIIDAAHSELKTGVIYSFAKPLKEVCHILFGGTEGNWYGDFKTERMAEWELALGEKYSTPRRIMQSMGTEIFRKHVDPDFWLMVAHRYMLDIAKYEQVDLIVVDDVRFDNEATFLRTVFGATIIQLQRVVPVEANDSHESERGVASSLIDYTYTCPDVECIQLSAKALVAKIIVNRGGNENH